MVAAEASTAAVALAVADFMAVVFPAEGSAVTRTAVITVVGSAEHAALTAATEEGTVPMAAAVPSAVGALMEACAAPLAPTMLGHPKVEVFATRLPAGTGLKTEPPVVGCPSMRDASEELPISTPPLPMAGSTLLAALPVADSQVMASIVAAS